MSASASAAAAEEPREFTKPGQKFATPSPGAGDRVFYTTLLAEKPDCAWRAQR